MYEELTAYITKFKNKSYGKWFVNNEEDSDVAVQLPFVGYERIVMDFVDKTNEFVDAHKEMELRCYHDLLAESGIPWSTESMESADVSSLDGRTVMALIVGAIRADRFCEGALLGFFNNGCIIKWLERLEIIDGTVAKARSLML